MIRLLLHRTTALFLILALLANNINTIVIIADFVMNQDLIAKTLCIQKEEPKGCNGKCQLKKELKENNTGKDSENPSQIPKRNHLDVYVVLSLDQNSQGQIIIKDTRDNQENFRLKVPASPFYDIDTPPPNLS